MAEVKELSRAEDEHIVFEKEREQSKTADTFELLRLTITQLETVEKSISITEKLFDEIRHRQEECTGVPETLSSIETALGGIALSRETKSLIEEKAVDSAVDGVRLLLEKMHARKEYLEKRRAELENEDADNKKSEHEEVTIDADLDSLAEHEKIEELPWKTVHEDGVYRMKTATVSIPHKKNSEQKNISMVLIENSADVKDDVIIALENPPRADMLSIPEVFEELEKMGTSKKRNIVEIDADRRKFYEDLIRADLLSGSIVEGSNGNVRLTIHDQAVPWSFLPPDEFVAIGKINARKYDGSMDTIHDVRGRSVPREVSLDEIALKAYVKGGDAWEEHQREQGVRMYTTKSGEQASQDKG